MMLCVWQVSHGKKAEKIDFGYHSPIVISSAEDVDATADINLKDDAGEKDKLTAAANNGVAVKNPTNAQQSRTAGLKFNFFYIKRHDYSATVHLP